MAQVRDELDQLRRLNRDLLALQVQANRGSPNPSLAALPAVNSANGELATHEVLARIEPQLQTSQTAVAIALPIGETLRIAKAAPEAKQQPANPPESERRDPRVENGKRTREGPPSSKPPNTRSQNSAVDQEPAHPNRLADEQIHGLLCRRMAELQKERQGRWQRICDLMLGR